MAIYEQEDFSSINDEDKRKVEESVFKLKKLRLDEQRKKDIEWLHKAFYFDIGGEG